MSGHGNDTNTGDGRAVKSANGESVTLSVRVPVALLEAFKPVADAEFDTVSNQIRMLMREAVRRAGGRA